jgi:hypothetical protein
MSIEEGIAWASIALAVLCGIAFLDRPSAKNGIRAALAVFGAFQAFGEAY